MRLLPLMALLLLAGCRDTPVDTMRRARNATYEKNPQEALRLYRLALDAIERDDSLEAQVLKAQALRGAADVYRLELRDMKQAVAVYRELIAQCPEAPETLEARVILASLLQHQYGDLRGAINELTSALARNPPESAELNYTVAKLYFQLQDYPQCELEAQRVAAKYETSQYVDDALLLRAQALAMVEGRRADAIRAFEDLAHRFPDSELTPHALFELGKIRAELGENERAIELWVQALGAHPQPELVQSAIARVRARIAQTTPTRVGDESTAFDRGHGPVVVTRHASSEEAMSAPSLGQRPAPKPPPVEPAPAASAAPAATTPAPAPPPAEPPVVATPAGSE